MWLGNHLFRSIFTVGLPRPEASTPCLDAAPSSAPLIFLSCQPPSGPSLRGPTMTLVNAQVRGLVGTQAPQSRVVNLFSKETMTSPCRPTWLPVTGRVQCTEVTFSCSCFNQHPRVLNNWLGLNVACASQVYVKYFESARFMHCSITCNFLVHSLSSSSNSLVSYLRKNRNFRLSTMKGMIFLQ